MVMKKLNPPPGPSTPENAPWTDAQTVIAKLDAILNALNALKPQTTGTGAVPSEQLVNVLQALFFLDPSKVLALLAIANPNDCDTTPLYLNVQLSPGQTLIIDEVPPHGQVVISTGGLLICDTPQALSLTISFDGKTWVSAPTGPALAGMYPITLSGYNTCTTAEYTITNNHSGTVAVTFLGQGAYLSSLLWNAILAQMIEIRNDLFPM